MLFSPSARTGIGERCGEFCDHHSAAVSLTWGTSATLGVIALLQAKQPKSCEPKDRECANLERRLSDGRATLAGLQLRSRVIGLRCAEAVILSSTAPSRAADG